MANNCFGVTFTAYCPDGSEFSGDAGDYFAGLDMARSGGAVNQADIAGGGQCSSLAGEHYETYTCPPLAIAPLTDSQIIQKRRIPPLGPKATMRRASGRQPLSRASNLGKCDCGMNERLCNMDVHASCKECCDAFSSDKMLRVSGSGKTKVATAVNWLTPLI